MATSASTGLIGVVRSTFRKLNALAEAMYRTPYDDLADRVDRKSTRLNSSHGYISYAVFCLKKKKHNSIDTQLFTILSFFTFTHHFAITLVSNSFLNVKFPSLKSRNITYDQLSES